MTTSTHAGSDERTTARCAGSGLASVLIGEGDTWFDVARDADVSMRALFAANDADADAMLHPGDVVCLPQGATTASNCTPSNAPLHTVEAGDTWWDLARRADVSMSTLLSANGADEQRVIRPGERVCLPPGVSIGAASTVSERRSSSSGSSSGSTSSSAVASGLQALPMRGPCWYGDSWGHGRGDGRRHQGVDLFAALDSHVYAVVDGTLTGRAWDQPGLRAGNAWWLTADDGTYYFYAHLSDFAPDLKVGSRVQAGQIIGFMGNTGNSAFPHLHFEIHPGGGSAVNPYPVLRSLGGCKTGGGYRQPGGWVAD